MADVTKVELATRLKLFRNSAVIYDQPFSMNATTYSEHASDRLILATNMGAMQEYNMGGIVTGTHLQVRSDRPILMSLDATTNPWNLGRSPEGGVIALIGAFTHVYFQNTNTTNKATIDIVIADENA